MKLKFIFRFSILLTGILIFSISCKSKKNIITRDQNTNRTHQTHYEKLKRNELSNLMSAYEHALAPGGTEKINSLSYSGTVIDQGKKVFVKYYHQRNHTLWVKTTYAGRQIFPVIYTPAKKAKWTGINYEKLNYEEQKTLDFHLKSDWIFLPFYLFKYHPETEFVKLLDFKNLDGRDVDAFSTTYQGTKWHFFFDKTHHYLIRLEKWEPDGKMIFRIDFMDFRPVENIYLAHYWIVKKEKNPQPFKVIWKQIKINYIEKQKF